MNIALIGFGGVGKALIKLLMDKEELLKKKYNLELKVKYIIKSDGGIYNPKGINLEEISTFINSKQNINKHSLWTSYLNINSIIENNDIDTLIELTSTNIVTGEPGLTHIKNSLNNKINVVTGNKGPILLKYRELKELAENNNVKLKVGCTTGGALPSINGGIYDIAASELISIEGILNGTTNYILSKMANDEVTYEEALKKAQLEGIAELDPTLDVEGFDTACKMIILANVLMDANMTLKDIDVEGITKVNIKDIHNIKGSNKKIKLIGKIEKENKIIKAYVKPITISEGHPLYSVDYKNKGIYYKTDTLGDITIIGGASGTVNAAASILRDIVLL